MRGFITKAIGFIFIFFLLVWWGGSEAFAVTYDVDIKASGPAGAFNPSTVNINTGDTVRWTSLGDNQQVASDKHPIHADYPDPACPNASCLESALLSTNDTYSFTFLLGGTWEYHNHQLPGRTGTVIVSDLNAPAVISDFAASNATITTIDLSWTSPGDDVGSTGNFFTPTTYDVRYSTSAINDANWGSATVVTGEPTPSIAGFLESMTVSGLTPLTTYYFAMKTSDEVPNESALSNGTSLKTIVSAEGGGVSPETIGTGYSQIPPAAITDLVASNATASSVDLTWTAPGGDGNDGTAARYDIRYAITPITESDWFSATQFIGEPTPAIARTAESVTITMLSDDTVYYFAIKTSDQIPIESKLSNGVSLGTEDIVAPGAVGDLAASNVTASSIDLTWSAPGDNGYNGKATINDIRYSTDSIGDVNWSSATQVTGEPTPAIAGFPESMTISGLSSDTRYYFAIKTLDEVLNESDLSNEVAVSTDTIAPAEIVELAFVNFSPTAVKLSWSAPGDNEHSGVAASYDIRYAVEPISDENWDFATSFINIPPPQKAGSPESLIIVGLEHGTTYYIALKTSDEAGNESGLSPVVTFATSPTPVPFEKDLSFGQRGDDVKQLQEFLDRDPKLYPEGLVTGYFGVLTQRAVQRFQAKYDIVSYGDPVTTGFGRVGPKTRAKLNELLFIQPPAEPYIESPITTELTIQNIESQINAMIEQIKDLQRQLDNLLNR